MDILPLSCSKFDYYCYAKQRHHEKRKICSCNKNESPITCLNYPEKEIKYTILDTENDNIEQEEKCEPRYRKKDKPFPLPLSFYCSKCNLNCFVDKRNHENDSKSSSESHNMYVKCLYKPKKVHKIEPEHKCEARNNKIAKHITLQHPHFSSRCHLYPLIDKKNQEKDIIYSCPKCKMPVTCSHNNKTKMNKIESENKCETRNHSIDKTVTLPQLCICSRCESHYVIEKRNHEKDIIGTKCKIPILFCPEREIKYTTLETKNDKIEPIDICDPRKSRNSQNKKQDNNDIAQSPKGVIHVHSSTVIYFRKNYDNAADKLTAQVMNIPFEELNHSNYCKKPQTNSEFQKQDMYSKLMDIYKACNCRDCICLPPSLPRQVYHTCETSDVGFKKVPHSGCTCIRCDRKDCKGVVKKNSEIFFYKPDKNASQECVGHICDTQDSTNSNDVVDKNEVISSDYCICIPCDKKDMGQCLGKKHRSGYDCMCVKCDRKDSSKCKGVVKKNEVIINYDRKGINLANIQEPCICTLCEDDIKQDKSVLPVPKEFNKPVPVEEIIKQTVCECGCECHECAHNNKANPKLPTIPQYDCDPFSNDMGESNRNDCVYDSKRRALQKSMAKCIRKYEIHRALLSDILPFHKTKSQIISRSDINAHSSVSHPFSVTLQDNTNCQCKTCECDVCKDKKKDSVIFYEYANILNEFNNCNCAPCECQICKEVRSDDNISLEKYKGSCRCEKCECISCSNLLNKKYKHKMTDGICDSGNKVKDKYVFESHVNTECKDTQKMKSLKLNNENNENNDFYYENVYMSRKGKLSNPNNIIISTKQNSNSIKINQNSAIVSSIDDNIHNSKDNIVQKEITAKYIVKENNILDRESIDDATPQNVLNLRTQRSFNLHYNKKVTSSNYSLMNKYSIIEESATYQSRISNRENVKDTKILFKAKKILEDADVYTAHLKEILEKSEKVNQDFISIAERIKHLQGSAYHIDGNNFFKITSRIAALLRAELNCTNNSLSDKRTNELKDTKNYIYKVPTLSELKNLSFESIADKGISKEKDFKRAISYAKYDENFISSVHNSYVNMSLTKYDQLEDLKPFDVSTKMDSNNELSLESDKGRPLPAESKNTPSKLQKYEITKHPRSSRVEYGKDPGANLQSQIKTSLDDQLIRRSMALTQKIKSRIIVEKESCDHMKANFKEIRRVSDKTILVRWEGPTKMDKVQAYELLINGHPMQVFSPTQCTAVITRLPHKGTLLISLRTIYCLPCDYWPTTTVACNLDNSNIYSCHLIY